MKTDDYLKIRSSLLFAQMLLEAEIKKGDAFGMYEDHLKKNKLALDALEKEL